MAKIVIEVRDKEDGNIEVKCTPSMENILKMEVNDHNLTAAHGLVFKILNDIRKESKRKDPTKIFIPRTGKFSL